MELIAVFCRAQAVGVICKAAGGRGARVVEYSEIDEAVSAEVMMMIMIMIKIMISALDALYATKKVAV